MYILCKISPLALGFTLLWIYGLGDIVGCRGNVIADQFNHVPPIELLLSIPTQQPTQASASHGIPISQYDALETMYNLWDGKWWSWDLTAQDNSIPWAFTSPTANPCLDNWQGITCNQRCSKLNLPCYITEIQLSQHNLTGTIPKGLFPNLTTLTVLDLGHNLLYGTIPSDLSTLTSIQTIKLNFNLFINGTLPSNMFLPLLHTLTYADFSQNFLEGLIPSSIYQCSNLTLLDFGKNLFHDIISQDICKLKQLQLLSLRSNYLHGSIPDCIGTEIQNLTSLYLNLNDLTGPIPTTLTSLSYLEKLVLSHNNLTGSIPEIGYFQHGNWSQLRQFDIWNNSIVGTISDELVSLPKLQIINIAINHIYSTIPNSISNLIGLNALITQNNYITGTLPDLSRLTELFLFDISVNLMTGPILPMPNTSVVAFSVGANGFTGSVPMEFNRSHLIAYYAGDTMFEGNLPANLGEKPVNLQASIEEVLNIDNNVIDLEQFEAIVAYIIGGDAELQIAVDTLIEFIEALDNILFFISTSNSLLTGSIPNWITTSPYITYISLNDNYYTGTIPDITTFSIVQFTLNDNLLSGSIPEGIKNLPNLVTLQWSNNYLTGSIPLSLLVTSDKLQSVLLQGNSLTGTIPDVVKDATPEPDSTTDSQDLNCVVENFDVSSNQLSGTLPDSLFTHFPYMSVFSGGSNCITGSLPISICQSPRLSALSLDGMTSASSCRQRIFPFSDSFVLKHTIHGSIPSCIFSMSHIESLHLSGNGIEGSLPNIKNISNSFIDLEVSHNFITGDIPILIQLHEWQTIDLSYNKIEGTFMNNINIMNNATFDAEVNRLSGDIPIGLLHVKDINILNGNVFNCNLKKSNIPHNDPKASSYECGSDSVNQSLFAWLVLPLLALLCLLIVKLVCFNNKYYNSIFQLINRKKKEWNNALLQDSYAIIGSNGILSLSDVNANGGMTVDQMKEMNRESMAMASGNSERYSMKHPSSVPGLIRPSDIARGSIVSTLSTTAAVAATDSNAILVNNPYYSGVNINSANVVRNHFQRNSSKNKKFINPFKELRHFFEQFRQYTAILTGWVVVIMMPMYLFLSDYERTYQNQYAWEFSAAYLTGLVSGMTLLIMFGCILILMYYLFNVRLRWIFNVFGIVDVTLGIVSDDDNSNIQRRSSVLPFNGLRRYSVNNDGRDDSMMMSASMSAYSGDVSNGGNYGRETHSSIDGGRSSWQLSAVGMFGSRPSITAATIQQQQHPPPPPVNSRTNKRMKSTGSSGSSDSPSSSPLSSPSQSPSQKIIKHSLGITRLAGTSSNGNIDDRNSLSRGRISTSVNSGSERGTFSQYLPRPSEQRPSVFLPDDVNVATDRLELTKLLITGSINTTLMLLLNVIYVLDILYVQSTILITFSQILLAIIKLYWNNIAIWLILKKCKKELHKIWKLDRNSFKLITTEDVFAIALMIFFNNIIAPCISIMLVNPSCFFHAFKSAPRITSSYTYCSRFLRLGRQQDVCFSTAIGESSYDPAFFYSYNCASSMPWNYAAVYIYMMLISGVAIPITQMYGKYIYDQLDENSKLFKYLDHTLPRFWRKLRPIEEFVIKVRVKSKSKKNEEIQQNDRNDKEEEKKNQKERPTISWTSWLSDFALKHIQSSDESKTLTTVQEVEMLPVTTYKKTNSKYSIDSTTKEEVIVEGEKKYRIKYPQILHKGKIVVRLMGFFAILVSFGVIFPPLACMSCITIGIWSYFLQIHVGRVLTQANQLQYSHYIVQLYKDCADIVSLVVPTILPLMFITSMLLGFLVFDTIGDARGHRVATAPAVFLLIFPAVIWLFGKVNWMEVYRRVRETVYGWIYIIDPDMMARVRELQRLQEIEANEQEKEDEEEEEEERMQQREKGYPSESQGVMRESLANRRSSAGLAAASAYYNSISTPVGGKKGYMANKIVVDEEEDSESEEEEEEEEAENVGKNPTTGNNNFFSAANPLHSNA